jgi:hypothetical protein
VPVTIKVDLTKVRNQAKPCILKKVVVLTNFEQML